MLAVTLSLDGAQLAAQQSQFGLHFDVRHCRRLWQKCKTYDNLDGVNAERQLDSIAVIAMPIDSSGIDVIVNQLEIFMEEKITRVPVITVAPKNSV